jgi:cytochrome P450
MNIAHRPPPEGAALYPPTVKPPEQPLDLLRFLFTFVRNPLRSLPRPVYEEPLFVHLGRRGGLVWVTQPALVERILLHEHDKFPKTPIDRRVFGPILGQGILTAEGADWRWQRRATSPMFRHQDILRYLPTMGRSADAQLASWRGLRPNARVRVDQAMTDLTFDVITHTILAGADRAEGEAVKRAAQDYLDPISWEVAVGLLGFKEGTWHPGRWHMHRAASRIRAGVHAIVARRRAEQRDDSDIIARLGAAIDPETGQPMSDERLVDNLCTFLAAGHETTAKALTWALYLLARAPEWQDRVRQEVRAVCGAGPVEARHLDQLSVTQRVLKESMRLYPPAPILSRTAAREVDLGGWRIGAGTIIVLPIFAIHRHRKLWHDPDRFDPDRFLPDRESEHLRTQFMPFGFGPRTCIGMAFAMIEATVLLATLVRGASFSWDGRHVPEPVSRVTLRPRGGMPLGVTAL